MTTTKDAVELLRAALERIADHDSADHSQWKIARAALDATANIGPESIAHPAPTSEPVAEGVDTAELRALTFAYGEAMQRGTVPQSSKAWGDFTDYLSAVLAQQREAGRREGQKERDDLAAEVTVLEAALATRQPQQDALLEGAVQAVAARAGESETMLVINAFDAIRGLKGNRHALPNKSRATRQPVAPELTDGLIDRLLSEAARGPSIRDFPEFQEDLARLSTADRRTAKAIRKDINDTIDSRVRNFMHRALRAASPVEPVSALTDAEIRELGRACHILTSPTVKKFARAIERAILAASPAKVSEDRRDAEPEYVAIEGYDANDGVDGEHPRYGRGVFFTLNCAKELFERAATPPQPITGTQEKK